MTFSINIKIYLLRFKISKQVKYHDQTQIRVAVIHGAPFFSLLHTVLPTSIPIKLCSQMSAHTDLHIRRGEERRGRGGEGKMAQWASEWAWALAAKLDSLSSTLRTYMVE